MPTDGPDEGMPGGRGRAFDGDHPEPEGGLARRPASHEHLAQDRVAEDDGGHADDRHDHAGRALEDDPDQQRAARTAAATWMSASSSRAMARDAMPAVSKSSTTASGVTMPRGVDGHRWLRYRRPPRAAWPTPPVDVDRFITSHQASWAPTRAAHRGRGRRRGSTPPGRGGRAGAAVPASVDPPVPRADAAGRPGAGRPAHPPGRQRRAACSTAPGRARSPASRASSPPASPPRCGMPGGSCSWPPLLLFVPAALMGVWLAGSRRRARGGGSRRRCARPTSRTTSRRTTPPRRPASSPPAVTVNNIQVGLPGLRVRDPPVRGHGVHPRQQRGQRRPGRRPVRGRRPAVEVLRADPAARPARAVRHRRGRRRRAGHRVGDHRPGRPHPHRRPGGAGSPLGGDRARPGARLRRRRHDRGLRHPQRPAHRRCASRIGVAVFVAFWTYVVVLGRRAAQPRLHRRLRRARAAREAASPRRSALAPRVTSTTRPSDALGAATPGHGRLAGRRDRG